MKMKILADFQICINVPLKTIFKTIKIVLEKTFFQRGFEFFENISFIKKNMDGELKNKTC